MRKFGFSSVVAIAVIFSSFNAMAGVKGTVSNFVAGDSVSLVNPFVRNAPLLEKVAIGKKGEFEFKYNPSEMGYFYITFSNGKNVLIVLSPNNICTLDLDFPTGKMLKTGNSTENAFLKSTSDLYFSFIEKKSVPNANVAELDMAFITDMQNLLKNTPPNFAMAIITGYYGLPEDYVFSTNDAIMTALAAKYPSNGTIQSRKKEIDEMKRLQIGSPAPEITLSDPSGKMVSLSSLKGKVVLIDFWASWCRPCRMENPNVVRLYNTYKPYGFDILGVSLDNSKDAWLKAIEADGLTWHHVSDLKGWQSAGGASYGVRSIPFTVLVDRAGNIVAKGLRGEELENKVKELLLQK